MRHNLLSVLWAKKPTVQGEMKWLPLIIHMNDAAEAARYLWELWLPPRMRMRIAAGILIDGQPADDETVWKIRV
jgi:hypothetical protein